MEKAITTKQELLQEKPYNICLDCQYIGESCDGPNFLAMSYKRWVEWCNDRRKLLNLTNSQIADAANLAKSTVDNILAGRGEDTRMSTMQAITKVLVGGCWGKYPCHYASKLLSSESTEGRIQGLEQELDEKKGEINALRRAVDEANSALYTQTKLYRQMIADRDKIIAEKNRWIRNLAIALAIVAGAFIVWLLVDVTNGNIGFVRY